MWLMFPRRSPRPVRSVRSVRSVRVDTFYSVVSVAPSATESDLLKMLQFGQSDR